MISDLGFTALAVALLPRKISPTIKEEMGRSSYLSVPFRRSGRMREHPVDALRTTNSSCKRDHAGEIDAYGAITAFAEHAVLKDQRSHFLKKRSIDLPSLLI